MSSTVWQIACLLLAEKIYVPEPQLVVVGKASNLIRPWEQKFQYHGTKLDYDLDQMLVHKGTPAQTLKKCRVVRDLWYKEQRVRSQHKRYRKDRTEMQDLVPMYQLPPLAILSPGLEGKSADKEKYDAQWRQKLAAKKAAIRKWIGCNTEHSPKSKFADDVLMTIEWKLTGSYVPHGTGRGIKFHVDYGNQNLALAITRYMTESFAEINKNAIIEPVKWEKMPARIHPKYQRRVGNLLEATTATLSTTPLSRKRWATLTEYAESATYSYRTKKALESIIEISSIDHEPAYADLIISQDVKWRKNRRTDQVYWIQLGEGTPEYRGYRKITKNMGEIYVPNYSLRHIISRKLAENPNDVAYRERLWKIFQRMDHLNLGRPFFDLLYTTLRDTVTGEYDRRLSRSTYQESWDLNGWPEFSPDAILEGRKRRSKLERQQDKETNWLLDKGPGSSAKMTARELKELLSHLLVGDKVVQFLNNDLYPEGYRLVDDPRSVNFKPVRWADPTQTWPNTRSVAELRKAHLASVQLMTMVSTTMPSLKLVEDRLIPMNPKPVIEIWEDPTDPSQVTLTHERIEMAAWTMAKQIHKRQLQRTNYRDTVEACCEAIMSGLPRAIHWWNTGEILDPEATVWENTEINRQWIDKDKDKKEIIGSSFIYQYKLLRTDPNRSFTEIELPDKTVIESGKPIPSKDWPYTYDPKLMMEGKYIRVAGYSDPSTGQLMPLFELDEQGKEVVASHVPRELNVRNPEYDSSLEKVTGICKAPIYHRKNPGTCDFLYTGEFKEGEEKVLCPRCREREGTVQPPSIVRFNIKNSRKYRRKTRRWINLWADFVAATNVYESPHMGIQSNEDGSGQEWTALGFPYWRRICMIAVGPISRITKELFETPENEMHGFSKKRDKKRSPFQTVNVINPDGTKGIKRIRVETLSSAPFDEDDVQPKTRVVKGLNRSYQKYLKGSGGRREKDPVSMIIEKEERQGAFGIITGATETEAQQRDLRKWLNGAGPLTRNIRPLLERMVATSKIQMFKDGEINNLKPQEQIDRIIAAVGENNRMIKNAAKIGFMLTDE